MEETKQVGRPKTANKKVSVVFSIGEDVHQMYLELRGKGVKVGREVDARIKSLDANDIPKHNTQRRGGKKVHIGMRVSPESRSIIQNFKEFMNFSSVVEDTIKKIYRKRR